MTPTKEMEAAFIAAQNACQNYWENCGQRHVAIAIANLRAEMISSAVNWKHWKFGGLEIKVRACYSDAMSVLAMDADKEVEHIMSAIKLFGETEPGQDDE